MDMSFLLKYHSLYTCWLVAVQLYTVPTKSLNIHPTSLSNTNLSLSCGLFVINLRSIHKEVVSMTDKK